MKVKDITDRLGPYTKICIIDRKSEEGVVCEGQLINCRTFWDDREVAWIRLGKDELILEIE